MAETTKIQWCDHTFNHVRGCTKVSEGCQNCYAEKGSKRNPKVLGVWGPNGSRVVAAESYWREPLKWDRQAAQAGERRRVFCASLADVFEDWQGPMVDAKGRRLWTPRDGWVWDEPIPETPQGDFSGCRPLAMDDVRLRLFWLIARTPNLDWLLLTKRADRIADHLPVDWGAGYPNAWLGVSVENQQAADERIPFLLQTSAAVRFLSCEPLLSPVDLRPWIGPHCACHPCPPEPCDEYMETGRCRRTPSRIHWTIIGGESGPRARPCVIGWIRDLVRQCRAANVACFVKQIGARPTNREGVPHPIRDPKGGSPEEWAQDLRVRQMPGAQR